MTPVNGIDGVSVAVERGRFDLPPGLEAARVEATSAWGGASRVERLWLHDSAVWTGGDEGQWLGWLDVPAPDSAVVRRLTAFAERVGRDGFRYGALLGMGGSSLAPEMLRRMFGRGHGVDLRVLDSTDPAQVRAFDSTLDPAQTLFIVSSKSGTTLETSLFQQFFLARVSEPLGAEVAGSHFVAVTDPGSALDRLATERGFRAVFHGDANIGGRYSALSYFGTVPAAVMGLDVATLLTRGRDMAAACGSAVPAADNPGLQLGLVLGLAARQGRDKLTLVTSPGLDGLAAWIEQLVAESTGKRELGIIPIEGETLAEPSTYGDDRLFVSIRLAAEPDAEVDDRLARLAAAGHPVVRLGAADPYDVAAECFRWEFATAVAGAVLGVHPFDQPDVEASKAATRALTGEHAAGRRSRVRHPIARVPYDTGEITAFAAAAYVQRLGRSIDAGATLEQVIRAHCGELRDGDYFAVLAYVEMCEPYRRILEQLRRRVRGATRAATTLGFGPRFLHSTGQAHKGGPNRGVFLAITCADVVDVAVPGHPCTFGVVKAAQAQGDEEVLVRRGRRYLRLHVDGEVGEGLARVGALVEAALAGPVGPPDDSAGLPGEPPA